MYLLDTDFIVALLRNNNDAIKKAAILEDKSLKISVLTFYELVEGCFRSRYPEKAFAALLELISPFEEINIDRDICFAEGKISASLKKEGAVIGDDDTLIGSTAVLYNLTIVTRNTKHFAKIPSIKMEEW